MSVVAALDRFFADPKTRSPGATVLVAFSGGPDSTALLHALSRLARRLGLEVAAAHLDHGLDRGSAGRARHARRFARDLRVRFTSDRRPVVARRRRGESLEAAARRVRYDFLREEASRLSARYIATAHHADDQRETVVLRLLFGSGLRGLGAIPPARGAIVRPLLDVEPEAIGRYLRENRLRPVTDPTNLELTPTRNRIRHLLLPALYREDASLRARLPRVAAAARRAVARIDAGLEQRLRCRPRPQLVVADSRALVDLPAELRRFAVGTMCRAAGAPSPSTAALGEVERQILAGRGIGCDLAGGWRIESDGDAVRVRRKAPESPSFAYTLTVPGEVRLSELALTFRLTRRPVEPWMFRGNRRRTGLALDLAAGDRVTIRRRAPGDRIRPLGCPYSRRVKDVLIDRKVPRRERDRLPLLCVGGRVVWIPGVTIDHGARLTDEAIAWVGEIDETEA